MQLFVRQAVGLLIVLAFSIADNRCSGGEFDELVGQIEPSLNKIESYDVYLTATRRDLTSDTRTAVDNLGKIIPGASLSKPQNAGTRPPIIAHYRQTLRKDGHIRVEFSGAELSEGKLIRVSDRMVEYSLMTPMGGAIPMGTISAPREIGSGESYKELFKTILMTVDIIDLLRNRSGLKVTKIPEKNLLCIEIPPSTDNDKQYVPLKKYGYRIWLDQSHGRLPAKIETYRLDNDHKELLRKRTEVTKFFEFASGFWAPVNATVTFFTGTPGESYGKPANDVTLNVDAAKSRWNIELPDDLFELQFPAGTIVADYIRKTQMITGQNSPAKNADRLIENARVVTSLDNKAPLLVNEARKVSNTRVLLIAINLIIVVVLAVLIIYTRTRKRNPSAGT